MPNRAGVEYIEAMTRQWVRRSKVTLLVALLVSGGGGMPLLDGILFHRLGSTGLVGPRVEASSAAYTHGELCRLGWTLPHSPRGKLAGVDVRTQGLAVGRQPPIPLSAPRSFDRQLLNQSRAPPILQA